MILSCTYIMGLELKNLDKEMVDMLWISSDTDLLNNKSKIKTELGHHYLLNRYGIEFIDCFISKIKSGERIYDIVFDLDNLYSRKTAIIVEEFLFWFKKELLLPEEIKVLEVKVAEKNIPSLFEVL